MCRNYIVMSGLLFLITAILYMNNGVVVVAQQNGSVVQVNVGVILNTETLFGKMSLTCIQMALSDFYASNPFYRTRLVLNIRDSKEDRIATAAAAIDLIKNVGVEAIIGPEDSTSTNFVIGLGDKAQVPIISFSATSPFLSTTRNPYFIRTTQNDSSQVKAISAIVRAFDWKRVVLMYVDNEFGEGIVPSLVDALQDVDAQVPYRSVIPPFATDDQILLELYKLMTMPTRVFVVHVLDSLGTRIFTKAKQIGMMNQGYVWIMTNGITDLLSLVDPTVFIISMQGIVGVESYYPNTTRLKDFSRRWKIQFQQENPMITNHTLNIFGLQAYDTIWALAMAIEDLNVTRFSFQRGNVSTNATELDNLGISTNGPKLLTTLGNTSFVGLAGNFSLINGQFPSATFKIVNIDGDEAKGIGYWTPTRGIMNTSTYSTASSSSTPILYSTSKEDLAIVKWPGYSTSIPKGWEIPTKDKKLRIGVPVKQGYTEFVSVTRDKNTNETKVSGFCISVFEAAIKALPYAVPYEFIPFALSNGSSAGTYNNLVSQVYYQKYDAAVGDITITANRTLYVDFTVPFTDSGVSIIVPYGGNQRKNMWAFKEPLTWNLWLASGCSFIFIAFVVWVLEHQVNADFQGPVYYQLGTSFWFAFSTLAFTQREKILRNITRFVMIVWIFVVLILTQSYTGSLASQLTIPHLYPSISNLDELRNNRLNVGYKKNSFFKEMLLQMNFDASQLKPFSSPEECNLLLSKGSDNEGIAAAFDEVPYIKLFLSKYCNYTMVPVNFKTSGFAFAFPLGSPLVHDISGTILTVLEGPKIKEIENTYLLEKNCTGSNPSTSPNSLSLDSFRGLFYIVWGVGIFALLFFLAMFLYKNKDVVHEKDSWSGRIKLLCKRFSKKDDTSYEFLQNKDRCRCNEMRPLYSPQRSFPRRLSSLTRSDYPVFIPEDAAYHGSHIAGTSNAGPSNYADLYAVPSYNAGTSNASPSSYEEYQVRRRFGK